MLALVSQRSCSYHIARNYGKPYCGKHALYSELGLLVRISSSAQNAVIRSSAANDCPRRLEEVMLLLWDFISQSSRKCQIRIVSIFIGC
jgi:hypothetical protein